jgi:hypothetical protein
VLGLLPAEPLLVMFIPAMLPPDVLLLPVLFVLLLCANTSVTRTEETANAATIATIAIKFNLDMQGKLDF